MEEVHSFGTQADRPRKRRRRTMACTQCRSRKLRCDREYPTCGRCLKSRAPTKCTYEDGFLWQQPTTVTTTAFNPDRGSTVSMPRNDQTPLQTPPDSGLGAPSIRSDALLSTTAPGSGPNPSDAPHGRGKHGRERRDCFLETVLGAPKAAVNQEPYVNTGLLQRPRRLLPEPEVTFSSQIDTHDIIDEGDLDDPLTPTNQLDIAPRIMMRGRETKTRFSGSGIYANLVAQVCYCSLTSGHSPRTFGCQTQSCLGFVQIWSESNEDCGRGDPSMNQSQIQLLFSLIALLPTRAVADELISLYLTYIESTHRIMHVPTFLQAVDEFWASSDNPTIHSAAFVAQILLILACAWNFADVPSLQEKSPTPLHCHTALMWVLHAEKWINNAHIKRPEINTLRLYILLITAQNSFGIKRSQAWLATSHLVKSAMMAGYHRDPSKYARISTFNKEMRRRIWITIVELDLQVAIDRGMQPSVQPLDYDTLPPLNINDSELHEGTVEPPASHPISETTDCSFQTALGRSLAIRLKACSLMHSPRISCRYEEIQKLDWELTRHLSQIPGWPSAEANGPLAQQKVALWKSLMEIKLAQSLLSVHTPFAIEARREALFAASARSRLDAAVMILSTQRRLHETAPLLSLCALGEWTIQAYISICQVLHSLDSHTPNGLFPSTSTFQLTALPGIPDSLMSLVETALLALEVRFLLIVKGAKDYFFLSTISALVKAKLWPAQAIMYKQQVVERVLSFAQTLFTRHATCEHLGNPGMGNFKDNQVSAFLSTPGMAPVIPEFDGMIPPPDLGVTPPGDFDPFLDVFDWEDLTAMAAI
ncbi:uncharacterized protein N7483_007277 [Penicillium malachiteum]|uniref:uncharacterized protein n=1 Tax=Penicillium malachiteum TaxID=1324776 RepID=UPI0025487537|nr:uncharacterized protein N7483_007277 [Penicillium malachiteum]KAJ5725920.1 hypothetical protein N7483_007277 [Penicillium malachiteum]